MFKMTRSVILSPLGRRISDNGTLRFAQGDAYGVILDFGH